MKFSIRRKLVLLKLDNVLRWSAVAGETMALGIILQGMRHSQDHSGVQKKYASIQAKSNLIKQRNARRAARNWNMNIPTQATRLFSFRKFTMGD